MLFDLRRQGYSRPGSFDVVIVGGGLAGLVIARQLSSDGLSVAILESGGYDVEEREQALNEGTGILSGPDGRDIRIDSHLRESRARALGGTGNLWGGKCSELDTIDFETRHWIENSGWPIGAAELAVHLREACRVLEIPPFHAAGVFNVDPDRRPYEINGNRVFTTGFRRFTPIGGRATADRWSRFKADACTLPNVTIMLHATVTRLVRLPGTDHITHVEVASPQGGKLSIRGSVFILAAGGIENPRLLLLSEPETGGIGNAHGLVGRYFAGHAVWRSASLDPGAAFCLELRARPEELGLYLDRSPGGLNGVWVLGGKAQRRDKLQGFSAALERAPDGTCRVYIVGEQRPNPESRVTCPGEPDQLGLPRPHLEWRFTREDIECLGRGLALFAAEAERSGLGRLVYDFDEKAVLQRAEAARHHMGTTRMHPSPERGVVDADCRVHGTENLFVAGASVFPTTGIANPTLTVIALSLRLAAHVARLRATSLEGRVA